MKSVSVFSSKMTQKRRRRGLRKRVLLSKRVAGKTGLFFHSRAATIAEELLFHELSQTKGDLFQKEIN